MSQVLPKPQVARFEEYDSDTSEVRPGTSVFAHSDAARQMRRELRRSDRQPPLLSNRGRERSNTVVATTQQQPASTRRSSTPLAQQGPSHARTTSRTESRPRSVQVHPVQLTRSNSASRSRPTYCTDPYCGQPGCAAARIYRSQSTVPQQNARPVWSPPPVIPTAQPAAPVYGYGPQPRVRTASFSQPRPMSWASTPTYVPNSQTYYALPQAHGPPPSPSASYRPQATFYQGGYTAPLQSQPTYPQPPPPLDTAMARLSFNAPSSATMSARSFSAQPLQTAPSMMVVSQPPALVRTSSLSARRPSVSRQVMPGAFPVDFDSDDIYYSDHDLESDLDERRSKRDSKLMGPPPRPIMRSIQTTPNLSARSVNESSRRAPHSDTGVDMLRTVDPDRTPRPSGSRRYSSTNSSSHSRRPSVSTTSSSGRTKATTISSGSGSARQIVVEDYEGRRREYQAKDRYLDQREQQIDEAVAYQRAMQGPQPPELTAENIRQMDDRKASQTRSRASGHSRQSGSRSEGVKVKYGESTFEINRGALEIRVDEEGKSAQFIVTPDSRDGVTDTRSSGSRTGRSRGGSERGSTSKEQPITEGKAM